MIDIEENCTFASDLRIGVYTREKICNKIL